MSHKQQLKEAQDAYEAVQRADCSGVHMDEVGQELTEAEEADAVATANTAVIVLISLVLLAVVGYALV